MLERLSFRPSRHQGPYLSEISCQKSRPWICLLGPHGLLSEDRRHAASHLERPVQLLFHQTGVWLIRMKRRNTSTCRFPHCRYQMQHTPLDGPRHKRPLLGLNLRDPNYPMNRSIHPLRYFHHGLRNHISRRSRGTTRLPGRKPRVRCRHND